MAGEKQKICIQHRFFHQPIEPICRKRLCGLDRFLLSALRILPFLISRTFWPCSPVPTAVRRFCCKPYSVWFAYSALTASMTVSVSKNLHYTYSVFLFTNFATTELIAPAIQMLSMCKLEIQNASISE